MIHTDGEPTIVTASKVRPVNYVDGWLNGTGWSRRATLKERVLWKLGLLKTVRR